MMMEPQLWVVFLYLAVRLQMAQSNIFQHLEIPKGLKLTVSGNVSSATIYYGQSLADKLISYIEDIVSATGDLEKSKTRASSLISEYNENKATMDAKVESMRERYMQQFSAMEAAVSGFNKTGEFLTGFIDSMKPKD